MGTTAPLTARPKSTDDHGTTTDNVKNPWEDSMTGRLASHGSPPAPAVPVAMQTSKRQGHYVRLL